MKRLLCISLLFLQLNLISNIIYGMAIVKSYDFKSYDNTKPSYKMLIPKWWNN